MVKSKARARLFLIDATAFCYRAFHAIKGLSTSYGQPTNAIYGFMNMLNKILKEKKPEYLAACFDVSRDTFRLKKFTDYKIQRPPMPDDLSSQIPLIKEIISAYGISILEKEGFEADDVIATMAKKAKTQGLAVTIVSSDKDLLQLVDENTVVFSPYKDEGVVYDAEGVVRFLGVQPEKIPEFIALTGDAVDNIPGAGMAEKAAVELITRFESLDKLLDNIDQIKEEKLKKKITENIDNIKLSKELAMLDKEMDLDFETEKLKVGLPDYDKLTRLFKRLEFKSFLKKLPSVEAEETAEVQDIEVIVDAGKLKDTLKLTDELILSVEDAGDFYFYAKDKAFRLSVKNKDLKNILSDPKIKKIGHDLKKIKVSLARADIALEGLYFDTMIAAYLVNPSRSEYNLSELAWDYLAKTLRPESIDGFKAINLIREIKLKLEKELAERELIRLFTDIEMPLIEVLAAMELTGIKLNLELLKDVSADSEKKISGLIAEIYRISGCEFNINSPKQLREVLFERLKLPVVKRTKTGPSTDEEVLHKLAAKHELPAILLEYRQLVKLKTTYVDALPQLVDDKTGRVHTSFNQAATETGRLSSSAPNLQNLPIKTDLGKNIRRAVIAFDKDSYILSCDYSQIELRVLAHISGDENLIDAFTHNKDVHKRTAALIYGLEEKDVDDLMRENAKRINFGIVYGLSSFGLSRDLGIDVSQAQTFIDEYFTRYPKVKEYTLNQIEQAEKKGFVATIAGRRRYLPEINNKNQNIRQMAERQAINTPIQGSAADLIKLAMIQVHKHIMEKKLKAQMILQVHDELVFDVPGQELESFSHLVRDCMENVLKLKVPIRVDIKKGKNWLEMETI